MPTYDFSCTKCEKGFEAYLPLRMDPNPPCECGGETERVWALGNSQKGSDTYPYITKNINGKPIEITSAAHLERVCKENGVTHRPDNGWIEKTYLGTDRKGKHHYHESSGRGMPGSWV